MAEKNLKGLLLHTLKDIYFAEHEILKTLPKMAQAAQAPRLKQAFEPRFPIWIRPTRPKAAGTLAKMRIPSFTRRVRRDSAT